MSCESLCIIHSDHKKGDIKKLTKSSIAKINELRKGWVEVSKSSSSFSEVACKSLEYIDSSGESNPPYKIEFCGFHLPCYRKFTDITKLEKARKTLVNASRKRPAEREDNESEEGQSCRKCSARLQEKPCQSSRSKHVLQFIDFIFK